MRFVVRCNIPTEAGNKGLADPASFVANIENYIRANKVEQSYFFEANGDRVAVFVLDMPTADKIPSIAEPFFRMGAKVELHPVMTLDDLKKGIQSIPK